MDEALSTAEMGRQFEQIKPWLREQGSRAAVIHAARSWASELQNVTVWRWVNALPAVHPNSRPGGTDPDQRDPDFDKLVEGFIVAFDAGLFERDKLGQAIAANTNLAARQCEERVLEYLNLHRGLVDARELQRELALSAQQLHDALEDLNSVGALQGPGFSNALRTFGWSGELSAYGRRLARGEAPTPLQPVHVSIHNSNVGAAGIVQGNVVQNVNPEVAEIVAALQSLAHAGANDAAAAPAVAVASAAREELQRYGWSAKANSLLSALGGTVQTAAALKPAYQIVQSIAAAHGLPLPQWQ